jgi:hypothetical protein
MVPKEYTVVTAAKLDELVEEVNKLIQEGWQLQGGASVHMAAIGLALQTRYAQAMVKMEEG